MSHLGDVPDWAEGVHQRKNQRTLVEQLGGDPDVHGHLPPGFIVLLPRRKYNNPALRTTAAVIASVPLSDGPSLRV